MEVRRLKMKEKWQYHLGNVISTYRVDSVTNLFILSQACDHSQITMRTEECRMPRLHVNERKHQLSLKSCGPFSRGDIAFDLAKQ